MTTATQTASQAPTGTPRVPTPLAVPLAAELTKPVDALSGQSTPAPLRLALTTQEACTALGICSVSLWRLEKRGLIRSVPHLRHKMWPIAELERFLNSAK